MLPECQAFLVPKSVHCDGTAASSPHCKTFAKCSRVCTCLLRRDRLRLCYPTAQGSTLGVQPWISTAHAPAPPPPVRLQLLSDLHLKPFQASAALAQEAVVLAGDIDNTWAGLRRFELAGAGDPGARQPTNSSAMAGIPRAPPAQSTPTGWACTCSTMPAWCSSGADGRRLRWWQRAGATLTSLARRPPKALRAEQLLSA